MTADIIPPFAALLRRYSFAYTASHDFDVCDSVMVEDYVLRMGEHEIRGRDDTYKPATQKQYRQYPGLGFTVHALMTNGDRAAMHFSEHGRSVLTGVSTSWRGISLYRWNGERLTECRVEQDYHSRRRQSEGGLSHAVPAPGIDPWSDAAAGPSPVTEARVRDWLASGRVLTSEDVVFDDEADSVRERAMLTDAEVSVLDLFSSGERAAFHIRVDGTYDGGLGDEHLDLIGRRGSLYATGFVTSSGRGISGSVVSDRLAFTRRLLASSRR